MTAEDSRPRRVLVVDEWFPAPDRDSGSLRMRRLLDVLRSLGWEVTFAARTPGRVAEARLRSEGFATVPENTPLDRHLDLAGELYDAVVLSRPDVAAALLSGVRRHAPQATLILDSPDLYFVREYRQARLLGSRPSLERALARKRQELDLARAADWALVVSGVEKRVLEAEGVESVHVVSNIHEGGGSRRSFSARRDVLFVGNFAHEPNVDAARHLLDEVWPRARPTLEDTRLFVVGPDPPEWLRERGDERVVVTGHVPEISTFLDASRLSVAPLRFGAGVKGKVLESLGRGLPVVGSSIAFEGLPVRDGREVLVAEDAEATAASIVALHENQELWDRLSGAGPRVVEEGFSFAAAQRAVSEVLGPVRVHPERVVSGA